MNYLSRGKTLLGFGKRKVISCFKRLTDLWECDLSYWSSWIYSSREVFKIDWNCNDFGHLEKICDLLKMTLCGTDLQHLSFPIGTVKDLLLDEISLVQLVSYIFIIVNFSFFFMITADTPCGLCIKMVNANSRKKLQNK